MSFLKRLFGGESSPRVEALTAPRQAAAEPVFETAAEDGETLVELDIVGESYRQAELEAIAGPKDPDGKRTLAGVTLRCEPSNEHDRNAIRVEVYGQLVGYVARDQAALLCPAITRACRGVLEARGLIVGGWKIDDRDSASRFAEKSEGSFGIRAWITMKDAARLEVDPVMIDPSLRPRLTYPTLPPIARGEMRLGPSEADIAAERYGSVVTVVNEEHYQEAIVGAVPDGWDDRSWPLLVDLGMTDCNPHAKQAERCVVVRLATEPVGYFTPAMSRRHAPAIDAAIVGGQRVTAVAHAARGTKGNATFWRLKVTMTHAAA